MTLTNIDESKTEVSHLENVSDPTEEKTGPTERKKKIQRILVALFLVGLIIFVILDSFTNQYTRKLIQDFLTWVEQNPTEGVFAFMGVYIIATVLFVPGSILTLGIGFIFANTFGLGLGTLYATIAVFVGASIGELGAFLIARYLLRDWVSNWTKKYKIFAAIDSALAQRGFRIMVLLRLSPIIPFNALNYMAGITGMKLIHYFFAMFAILPGTILYVFIGASAGSLTDSANTEGNKTVQIVTIVFSIVFGILGVGAISYYAKKELNAAVENETSDEPHDEAVENNTSDKVHDDIVDTV